MKNKICVIGTSKSSAHLYFLYKKECFSLDNNGDSFNFNYDTISNKSSIKEHINIIYQTIWKNYESKNKKIKS